MKKEEKIILALNTHNLSEARKLVNILKERAKFFKVGIPLFLSGAEKFIQELLQENLKVFLDLKFHDIPSVVALAVEKASYIGVEFLTLHTLGGFDMLEASAKAAWKVEEKIGRRPKLIGVTLMTSMGEAAIRDMVGIGARSPAQEVEILANMGKSAGLDGAVSSAFEAKKIKEICGKDFIVITPGIRLPEEEHFDQERVATPAFAFEQGADYIVVGRPITEAKDPVKKFEEYLASF